MNLIKRTTQRGFTLIEMIVSLALFSVVVTVAIGALLVLVGSNEDLQGEQSVMTNLSFALDSMTREIRTGTRYYCVSAGSQTGVFNNGNSLESIGDNVQDCATGMASTANFHGVSFLEAGESITGSAANRILYFYDKTNGQIYRRVGDNPAQSIVSSGIYIENANFFVSGSASVDDNGNTVQPTVTIHIEAIDVNDADPNPKSYFVQTTITQRTLDI